jgi:hypothetical protein
MRAPLSAIASVAALLLAAPALAQTPTPYKIVTEERGDTTRTIDVRLERRADEADLDAIANVVAARDPKPYARTIVNFLLPATRAGEAPWATATLQREVKVKIPGLRLDEEKLFIAEAHADTRNVVGAWLTSTPATPGRLTIFREGRQVIAEWRLRSGVRSRDELTETRLSSGRRFDLKSGTADDHFILTQAGDLEIRSQGKLIAVAEPIKPATAGEIAAATQRPRGNSVEPWPLLPAAAPAPGSAPAVGKAAAAAEPASPDTQTAVKAPARPRPAARKDTPAEPRIDLTKFLNPSS